MFALVAQEQIMNEPTIKCPSCGTEIKLTESLAAPLVEATRREYEVRLTKQASDFASKEESLSRREEDLEKEKESVDAMIAEKLRLERTKVAAEESRKAKLALAQAMDHKDSEIANLNQILEENKAKLGEAQKAQAELIRKQRELDDAKREMELTIEQRVQASLDDARERAKREAAESLKLKVAEKEQTITLMKKQIDDLKQKAEQGSQQLQGEVQEIELESLLSTNFQTDAVRPVPKGEFGGDVLQEVFGLHKQKCGTIRWESKNWSDSWLAKLRDDQRGAQADVAILVSQALPRDLDTFGLIDGIWVIPIRAVVPVASTLRHMLVEIALARQAAEGQNTKMSLVYQYLTGSRFRQRVQAIVEAFSNMGEDLNKEKKAIMKQWAKREQEIERVMQATVSMYGDLQGIAGKTLLEVEGLDLKALEAAAGD
jgi:hypothetical protein